MDDPRPEDDTAPEDTALPEVTFDPRAGAYRDEHGLLHLDELGAPVG